MTELLDLSAVELKRLFITRELSPSELLAATMDRIAQVNPVLNAVVTTSPDLAKRQAKIADHAYARAEGLSERPLLGLPITFKDTIATEGIRTTGGSLLWRDNVPIANAPVVERAYAAGVVMLGKTNTPEFGWKGETSNRVFGTTRNPWDPERTPGGSSGGAAASVATGIGPFAVGGDGAGSIRIPAAYTGTFGFKCSFGRIPDGNGSVETLSSVGIVARHVRDAALLFNSVSGFDSRDRLSLPDSATDWVAACSGDLAGVRVAWSSDLGYGWADDDVAGSARAAAFALSAAGAIVEEVSLDFDDPHDICYALFAAGSGGDHQADWEKVRELVDEGRQEMILMGFEMSGADVGSALDKRAQWTAKMNSLMDSYELLLTPTMPTTAFQAGLHHPPQTGVRDMSRFRWTPFTYGMNLTGQPAASVPCGYAAEGLPVGVQVIGRRLDDALVLRAAAVLEELRPWHERRPAILERT